MLAKRFCGNDKEVTLKEHVDDMLKVFESLKIAFPFLPKTSNINDFWGLLRLAIIFHDLGKCTSGFQELMVCERKSYPFRHEWISCGVFLNMPLQEEQKILIANAILAHHKDFLELKKRYKQSEVAKKDFDNGEEINIKEDLFFENEFKSLNFNWIKLFLSNYGINFGSVESINPLPNLIKEWIKDEPNIDEQTKFKNIFLSATLSICDHNASAGINKIAILENSNFDFLKKFMPKTHQIKCWDSSEDVLLIAPTGSGKTESAIGWIKSQLQKEQSRVFYILPFTASINAMTTRMINNFESDELVGLLHGKAKFFIDEKYEKKDGQTLSDLIDTHKKINRPFKITTPYQVLKWAFGVKGFEKGLTELSNSCLVFDEIHIYDKEIFQRILFFLRWLQIHLKVKIFIMTATMPSFLQKMMAEILGIATTVRADDDLLKNLIRHKIKILEGNIEAQINFASQLLSEGKSLIVVCNTVAKAQEIYQKIEFEDKLLLHSRFNARDRTSKEQILYSNKKPKLLIGTQAIEVSLDIDYDAIITELAPLDSLLQRFGRVFRKRSFSENLPPNCYVANSIEKRFEKIYDKQILEKTFIELCAIDEQLLDESKIQSMLDMIYMPFEIDDNLNIAFSEMMDSLFPFKAYEENEEKFERQFDGVQVLPYRLVDEFKQNKVDRKYLDAEKLLIPVSSKFYKFLLGNGLAYFDDKNIVARLDYCQDRGLLIEIDKDSFFA